MPLRDDLLKPIPGASPAGADIRYDPLYDKIKEARREDDDAPQGDWQIARKVADWPAVIKQTSDAIATKSKDLQLAAWLTEAALRRDGFAGLRDGLLLLRSMLEQFWETLYPELEDGDAELRAAPLEWVGLRLDGAVKRVPLDRAGHDFFQYRESRLLPTEADAAGDEGKTAQRARALADGKLLPEEFDNSFGSTPKPFYKALVANLDGALEALEALDEAGRERFGDSAPGYAKLRGALQEVRQVGQQLLKRKLELDPDPVELQVGDATPPAADAAAASAAASAAGPSGPLAPEPVSRDDAAARVASAARYLRRTEPLNPASYLMLRGFRWGELRAGGSSPNPRLLEAPATQTRTQLKGLLLDQKWPALLETAEQVMGTPQGRGWLDLQRYALAACAGLGVDYDHVGAAIRGELRALLSDLPQLLEMTLMDDTPTANAETRTWIRDSVLGGASGGGAGGDPAEAALLALGGDGSGADGERPAANTFERALGEVRAGRPERGVEMLMRELAREKSRRGRFLRQTQVARVMVEAGLHAVAMPMLEELMGQVDALKLEEWEDGGVVAQPMSLLYRCMTALEGPTEVRQTLYLRICRLDPLAAIGFQQTAS